MAIIFWNEMIWKNLPINKHTWAFYYFCKRCGDKVWFRKYDNNTMDLHVEVKK